MFTGVNFVVKSGKLSVCVGVQLPYLGNSGNHVKDIFRGIHTDCLSLLHQNTNTIFLVLSETKVCEIMSTFSLCQVRVEDYL